jgi:cytochrome c biogenesis protein CcmG, thiol:disulfide interchange protein DsbE
MTETTNDTAPVIQQAVKAQPVTKPPRMGPARKTALAIAVVLIGFTAVLATRKASSGDNIRNELLGQVVPSFGGKSLIGSQNFSVDQQRGKFVVINFFATWCITCVQEHPELVAFAKDHPEIPLVSVVLESPEADVTKFFKARGGTWPVLNDRSIPVDLGVRTAPETYLVDPNGRLFAQFNGGISKSLLEDQIAMRATAMAK